MALLEFSNLTYGYGELEILSSVGGALHPGNVVGLVGPNGGGKTTLLRLFTGEMAPGSGRIQRQKGLQLGYVSQAVGGDEERQLFDYVREGRSDLATLEAELRRLEAALAQHPGDAQRLTRLGETQARFATLGGHRWDSEVERLLMGLGFLRAELVQPLGSLSGGQRQKAALARTLLSGAQCLLFDEPTNHLDLDAQAFFANYLGQLAASRSEDSAAAEGRRAALLVSHDRWLLRRLCTHIWELEDGTLHRYNGGYDKYVPMREQRREQSAELYERQQAYIARTEDYIRRHIAGQNTRQARGRRTHLARMERLSAPGADPQMAFVLKPAVPTGEQVLVVEDLGFSYGGQDGGGWRPDSVPVDLSSDPQDLEARIQSDIPNPAGSAMSPPQSAAPPKTHVSAGNFGLELNPPLDYVRGTVAERQLLSSLGFTLHRGERLAIVGPNGCGKTTLLKLLTRQLAPDHGLVAWGSNVELGLFSQDSADLRSGRNLLAELREVEPAITDGDARGYLARFGFSGDDVMKDVGALSGGERSRLSLAKIFRRRPNVLVLDEPTNHLDIYAREALEQFLDAYEGTILMVTHDRALLERLCRRLVVFETAADSGADAPRFEASFFRGGYEQYTAWRELKAAEAGTDGAGIRSVPDSVGGGFASPRADAGTAGGDELRPYTVIDAEATVPGLELSYAELGQAAAQSRTSVAGYCRKQAEREQRRATEIEARITAVEEQLAQLTGSQREADMAGRYGEVEKLQHEIDATLAELEQAFEQLDSVHLLIESWLAAAESG